MKAFERSNCSVYLFGKDSGAIDDVIAATAKVFANLLARTSAAR